MGYTTYFYGSVSVEPPLNETEVQYLRKFSYSRRMHREKGPYFVDGEGFRGQGPDPDILDQSQPSIGQPGLWCQWLPTDDGNEIVWDEGEKFYYAPEWMKYLIQHFLAPGAIASLSGDPQFADFTFNHTVNGVICAEGEESSDRWDLIVENNVVYVQPYEFTAQERVPV